MLGDSWALSQRQPKVDDRIFPVHPQTKSKYFTEACRALSIPNLHLHDLRHEGVSKMFEQGFDIPHVAVVSDHKDWKHLKRYSQIKPESLHDHGTHPEKPPSPEVAPALPAVHVSLYLELAFGNLVVNGLLGAPYGVGKLRHCHPQAILVGHDCLSHQAHAMQSPQ